jgi:hypothetical protein
MISILANWRKPGCEISEKERSAILTAGHQDSLDWFVGAGDERGNIVVQFFERLQEAGY